MRSRVADEAARAVPRREERQRRSRSMTRPYGPCWRLFRRCRGPDGGESGEPVARSLFEPAARGGTRAHPSEVPLSYAACFMSAASLGLVLASCSGSATPNSASLDGDPTRAVQLGEWC